MAGAQQISSEQVTLINERQSFFESTLRAALQLLAASGSIEARSVINFIQSRLVLAMPLSKSDIGYWLESIPANPIYLVVVERADRWVPHLDEVTAQYAADRPGKSFAGYTRSMQAIYMAGSWMISEQIAGLAFFHEARHAWGHVSGADDGLSFEQREDRVRRFEIELLAGAYGDEWIGLVETATKRIADLRSGSYIRGLGSSDWPLPQLAEMLGRAPSDIDLHYRTGLLRRAAEYKLGA